MEIICAVIDIPIQPLLDYQGVSNTLKGPVIEFF